MGLDEFSPVLIDFLEEFSVWSVEELLFLFILSSNSDLSMEESSLVLDGGALSSDSRVGVLSRDLAGVLARDMGVTARVTGVWTLPGLLGVVSVLGRDSGVMSTNCWCRKTFS